MIKFQQNHQQPADNVGPPGQGEVQGFLSLRPGWVAIIAFPTLIGIIIIIAVVTSFVHYPEIVKARAQITISGNDSICVADIDAPQNNGFKIDSGQQVQLQFDDYPHTRYGFAFGILQAIQNRKGPNNLQALVYLPKGLTTSSNKKISLRHVLKADMLITVYDMKLYQRVFYNAAARKVSKELAQSEK